MPPRNTVLREYGILTFLGLSLLALVVPWSAHAGGVHVSVGFELPVPVAVVPAPVPVVVTPAPVVVQQQPVVIERPAPVIVYPAPVVVRRPPVVIEDRRVIVPGPSTTWIGEEILRLRACALEAPS